MVSRDEFFIKRLESDSAQIQIIGPNGVIGVTNANIESIRPGSIDNVINLEIARLNKLEEEKANTPLELEETKTKNNTIRNIVLLAIVGGLLLG